MHKIDLTIIHCITIAVTKPYTRNINFRGYAHKLQYSIIFKNKQCSMLLL